MKLHLHLIINSSSGGGSGWVLGGQLIQLLKEKEVGYTAYFTEKAGDEFGFARDLAKNSLLDFDLGAAYEDFPLLVVLGGDGTLSHVVDALSGFPDIPIAYIPAGSGNDFSRAAGTFSWDLLTALEAILNAGSPARLNVLTARDMGGAWEKTLVNSLGIGIDGAVINQMEKSPLKKTMNWVGLGSLSYPFTVLHVLFSQKPFQVEVKTGNGIQIIEDVFLATTTNHPFFGGGIQIAPGADLLADGLDLVIIQKKSWWGLVGIVRALLLGKHLAHPHVHHVRGSQLEIQVGSPQYAQADGEPLGQKPFHIGFQQQSRYFWLGELHN
ncbi:MAG: YegS/Rv2252/BmrU family lipid kinase [Turicibacter sp.]|nr:YegS/Rv2252/BmrU family lipid kinase [Turicibacter sp.]